MRACVYVYVCAYVYVFVHAHLCGNIMVNTCQVSTFVIEMYNVNRCILYVLYVSIVKEDTDAHTVYCDAQCFFLFDWLTVLTLCSAIPFLIL